MKILFLLSVAVLAQAVNAQPLSMKAAAELIALDRQIQHAMVAGDQVFLSQTLSDDFRFTHADGNVESKTDIIRLAGRQPRYFLRRDVLSPTVERHGSIALVLGTMDIASGPVAQEPDDAKFCYALNFVHLFVMRRGRWQMVSHRTMQITKAEAACSHTN